MSTQSIIQSYDEMKLFLDETGKLSAKFYGSASDRHQDILVKKPNYDSWAGRGKSNLPLSSLII